MDYPIDVQLSQIKLPGEWVMYLYNKQEFKKMSKKQGFQGKPYEEVCNIVTVNDLMYLLNLMEVKIDEDKINLDSHNYIVMRKGIRPLWEDPKNANGGTFTFKIPHVVGYHMWSLLMMYMLGETLNDDVSNINGISVSYIPDSEHNIYDTSRSKPIKSATYIKLWDSKEGRDVDDFISKLPVDITDSIKKNAIIVTYIKNNTKKDYNQKNMINRLHDPSKRYDRTDRGFNNAKKY